LLFAGLVGAALVIPLLMVYALVADRQHQARVAQDSITAGWAGAQIVAGPTMVIPYNAERVTNEVVDGKTVTRTVTVRQHLFLAPDSQQIDTTLNPEIKSRGSIYQSVIYDVDLTGSADFVLPDDLDRLGVQQGQLLLDEAEIRFPISDTGGLETDAELTAGGEALALRPGLGADANGSGMHALFDWAGGEPVTLDFAYSLRGSSSFTMVPRGKETRWNARSSWPHPSFTGGFLPPADQVEQSEDGFSASWSISNLALGQSLVRTSELVMPAAHEVESAGLYQPEPGSPAANIASIRLVEPVDLYSQVNRSVKYGFLFIGFTFLTFLMFDIIGGARVASAEYLLTGAGLVLFFVMLLAFAELIGFVAAYAVASAAIIGLLTAYSSAVLGSWKRAWVIGAILVGLYAVLYVLLNLETWSLVIGSLMLFVALAAVMYTTRKIDWSEVSNLASTDEAELHPQ